MIKFTEIYFDDNKRTHTEVSLLSCILKREDNEYKKGSQRRLPLFIMQRLLLDESLEE